jgi:hypothetical protein
VVIRGDGLLDAVVGVTRVGAVVLVMAHGHALGGRDGGHALQRDDQRQNNDQGDTKHVR